MYAFQHAASGGTLAYLDLAGTDPPVVLLPGLGLAAADYAAVARAPALLWSRVLLIDVLGFGFSDGPPHFSYTLEDHADVLAALLEQRGVRDCALVGHSFGGSLAIVLARRRPDLVARLAVAEANLDPGVGGMSARIAAQSEAAFVASGHALLCQELERQFVAMPDRGGIVATYRRASPIGLHRSAVSLLAARSPTLREQLVKLPQPRAYLFGERSLADPELARLRDWLAAQGVAVPVVPNAAHGMHVDNPAGFARTIADSLQISSN